MSTHPAPVPRAPAIVLVVLCSASVPAQTPAPAIHCDSSVLAPARDPLAYSRRGDRCEGLYVQQVAAGTGLEILSFTEPVTPFPIGRGDVLRLEWTAKTEGPVRIRAKSLKPRVYYRMDTERPGGTTTFDWPGDVLGQLQLQSEQVGVVAVMSQAIGGRIEDVYLPVSVGKGSVARTRRYVLAVRPVQELSNIFVTLTELDAGGRSTRTIKKEESIGAGFYPAGTRIAVPVPEIDRPGLYRLHLGATLARGGSNTTALVFFVGM